MANRNTILEELQDLCPAVVNLSRENVYTVPFDYFDKLATNVLSFVNQKVQVLPTSRHPYSIPDNYFSNLAFNILDKVTHQPAFNEVELELQQVAPLLNTINKQPLGIVPSAYFNTLATSILHKAKDWQQSGVEQELHLIAPLLNTIKKQSYEPIHHSYFDGLSEGILHKLKTQTRSQVEQELEEIAPFLNTINKNHVYTVPAGYFGQLKIERSATKPAKIVSLFPGISKMVKYAAAAVIGGVMITGSFLLFDNAPSTPATTKLEATAYKADAIKTLSNSEIIDYLNSNPSSLEATSSSGFDVDDNSLKSFLNEMSAEEIEQYLKENPDTDVVHSKEG